MPFAVRIRVIVFLVLLTGLVAAHTASAQQAGPTTDSLASVELPPALDRVLRDYERGWEARDARALADLFAPDGFVLRPGYPPVRGRDAIADAYAGAGGLLHLRALAYETGGDIAYIIGAYGPAADRPDAGKFVLTLRRGADGAWLITADMDNGSE